MNQLSDYLDAIRKQSGLSSDRAISRELAASPSTVSQWRRGSSFPTPAHMVRLAEMADMNSEKALIELAIWESERQGWADAAARYKAIAARIAVGLFAPALIYTVASSEGGGNVYRTSSGRIFQTIYYANPAGAFCGENFAPNCQGTGRLALSPPADGAHTCVLTGRTPDKGFLTVYTL